MILKPEEIDINNKEQIQFLRNWIIRYVDMLVEKAKDVEKKHITH